MDLRIKCGDAKIIEIERTVNSDTGEYEDLTGMDVLWFLYYNDNRKTPILAKDQSTGILITDYAKGTCEIRLRPSDTQDLAPDTYYYEVKIRDSVMDLFTIAEGTLTLYRKK